MENDKLFELMSKMYNEMNDNLKEVRQDINGIKQNLNGFKQDVDELKENVTELKQEVTALKDDVAELKQDVKVLYAKVEGDVTNSIKALHDGYEHNYEVLTQIKKTVCDNTESIDDINLNVIGMKEDINFIAGKTIRNDSKIDKISERLKAVK